MAAGTLEWPRRAISSLSLVRVAAVSVPPVWLKVLLRDKHWQNYSTFCAEYDKAARRIDPDLAGRYPSRAQLHRWLVGAVRSLPYADHCRVLEEMFPGWTAEQLFQPSPANARS
jgi:hypothetical protein